MGDVKKSNSEPIVNMYIHITSSHSHALPGEAQGGDRGEGQPWSAGCSDRQAVMGGP